MKASINHHMSPKTLKKRLASLIHFNWGMVLGAVLLLISPTSANANTQKYNIVTDEFYGLNAERILLVPVADAADQTVLMTGKCPSRAPSDLYLEDGPENAKEKWFVVTEKDHIEPDQTICLSGNLPAWFEKTASLH